MDWGRSFDLCATDVDDLDRKTVVVFSANT